MIYSGGWSSFWHNNDAIKTLCWLSWNFFKSSADGVNKHACSALSWFEKSSTNSSDPRYGFSCCLPRGTVTWQNVYYIVMSFQCNNYSQKSYIRRTKPQNLNVSRLVLQKSLPNPLTPENEDRLSALLQLHMSDQQFHCPVRCDLY